MAAALPASAPPVIRPSAGPDDVRTPLTPMRAVIAQRLLASKTQIPHFYLHIEIDAGPLMAFRAQANAAEEARGTGTKFTINDFILKAAAAAAVQVPAANAAFDVDAIVRFAGVHLSVAIAVDDGLVTPVIRDAQHKSLSEISAMRQGLRHAREAEPAQARRTRPAAPSPSPTSGPTASTASMPSSTRRRPPSFPSAPS